MHDRPNTGGAAATAVKRWFDDVSVHGGYRSRTTEGDRHVSELAVVGEFGPFDLLSERAHTQYLTGFSELAVEACRDALVLVTAAGDRTTARYLRYSSGVALQELGRHAEVVVESQRLLADIDALTEPHWRAKGLALLAEACNSLGETTRAMDALAEGSYLLASSPSRAYNHMSASMAVALALRAIQLYEQADDLLMAVVYGDEPSSDVLVLQEATLLHAVWSATLDLLGEGGAARRHDVVCLERSRRMRRTAQLCGDVEMTENAQLYEAYAWERLGDPVLAEQLVRQVVGVRRPRDETIESDLVNLTLGRVLAERGDVAAAREHLVSATTQARTAGRDVLAATGLTALADLDVLELGPHPAVARWRLLARELVSRAWRDREGRFSALRARIRVRELLDQTARMGQVVLEDPLTGLGNRRRLVEHVGSADRELSALFVDIDRFKDVNDRFSHEVGDEVLRRVATILLQHCRTEDVVVRYGGDEFLVLTTGDPVVASAVAQRVHAAVRDSAWDEVAVGLAVTISVGVATSLPAQDALGAADAALNAAKRAGRDQVVSA